MERIPLSGPRCDPFLVALQFTEGSGTILACVSLGYKADSLKSFVLRSLSNRCVKQETLLSRARLTAEFIDFARTKVPPFLGPAPIVAIVEWLDSIRLRGDSAPQQGLRALTVFNEALELGWNLKHPSIKLAKRDNPRRARRQPPPVPLEFILAVEKTACDGDQPFGIRLFCSCYLLTVLASLRFADALEIELMFKSDTALACRSVDQKNPRGELIWRATPRVGFQSNGAWLNPLWKYWGEVKPSKEGRYRYLFPYFSPAWGIDYNRRGSHGATQAALTRVETRLGFPKVAKLHIARAWFATCARQLLFGLEDRTTLGHWKEGSRMPNLYDRAVCATELLLRNQILAKLHEWWIPSQAIEVPPLGGDKSDRKTVPLAESSADSTSYTSAASFVKDREVDISKLGED